MYISNDTVMQKMLQEIQEARGAQSTSETATHIAHIKLLSELWLDEYKKHDNPVKEAVQNQTIMEPEKQHISEQNNQILTSAVEEVAKDKDEMSIFDF